MLFQRALKGVGEVKKKEGVGKKKGRSGKEGVRSGAEGEYAPLALGRMDALCRNTD